MRCILALAVTATVAHAQFPFETHTPRTLWEIAEVPSALAAAGDVDFDGVPDVLLGRADASGGAGYVRILSGADGAELWRVDGAPGQSLGVRVRDLGDVDGDSLPDVLARSAGGIVAFSGATRTALWSFSRDGMDAVVPIGDVNQDGRTDVAVGYPFFVPPGSFFGGEVVVHDGASGAILWSARPPAGMGVFFGESLAPIGDADDDGVPDLVVGDSLENSLHLLSGATGAVLWTKVNPVIAYSPMGRVVALSDLDGDGVTDMASYGTVRGTTDAHTWVLSGADGSFLWISTSGPDLVGGAQQFARYDDTAISAVDIDRRRGRDVIVGGGPWNGPGGILIRDGDTGRVLVDLSGASANEQLGRVVAGLGENGDGFGAFAVATRDRLRVVDVVQGLVIRQTGCDSSLGAEPMIGVTGRPDVGGRLGFTLERVPAGAMASLLVGGPVQGLELDVFGANGCSIAVSVVGVSALAPSTPGPGTAAVDFAVPPAALGPSVSFQWAMFDPGAPRPLPLTMSDTVNVTFRP